MTENKRVNRFKKPIIRYGYLRNYNGHWVNTRNIKYLFVRESEVKHLGFNYEIVALLDVIPIFQKTKESKDSTEKKILVTVKVFLTEADAYQYLDLIFNTDWWEWKKQ